MKCKNFMSYSDQEIIEYYHFILIRDEGMKLRYKYCQIVCHLRSIAGPFHLAAV